MVRKVKSATKPRSGVKEFLKHLGPGLITGASDDYPLTKDATITRAVAKAGRIIPLAMLRGLHHDTPEYDLR
jgi:hypothetical protein